MFKVGKILPQNKIIIHSDLETSLKILQQAVGQKTILKPYHLIFTNLDVYTANVAHYCKHGCNVTAFRVVTLTEATIKLRNQIIERFKLPMPSTGIYTSDAVLFDSVSLLQHAYNKRSNDYAIKYLNCDMNETFTHGEEMIRNIKSSNINGLTGDISFDEHGHRSDLLYHVLDLTQNGFFEEEPFVMYKAATPGVSYSGNDQFEGYCIDMIREIAKINNLKYTFILNKDGQYGGHQNGTWTGMTGDLVRGEADIALGPLTVSHSRITVIDFTTPFMHLGTTILYKRPTKAEPNLFAFLSPLSLSVWICMLFTCVSVGILLWIIGRNNPYEWKLVDENEEASQFTLIGSIWFSLASLLAQGTEVVPVAISTRVTSAFWWFFSLILISSYTANLAAFLTIERMVSEINNVDDLAEQTEIMYGTRKDSFTIAFFRDADVDLYKRMWRVMSTASPTAFADNTTQGVEWVKTRQYAYITDSPFAEYIEERDCTVMKVGAFIQPTGFGIGIQKGSPLRKILSAGILHLRETQRLYQLKEKWWKHERGGGQCEKVEKQTSSTSPLTIAHLSGVFILLSAGLVISFLIAIVEFRLWMHKNKTKKERVTNGLRKQFCNRRNKKNRQKTSVPLDDIQNLQIPEKSSHALLQNC